VTSFDIDVDTSDVRVSLENLRDRWETDATFRVGTNVEYGIILEMGRGPVEAQDAEALQFENEAGETIYRKRVSGHPPYPWFMPAIREFQANPQRFVLDNTGFNSFEEIPNGETLVRSVANALETKMTANVSARSGGDRSPGTHPDHPQRDSGQLAASISAVRVN